MTTEELVIGHYEKTLTPEQEAALNGMMETSPEARALFEEHGQIENMMLAEAEVTVPSSKLEKAVVVAALGTAAEIAGKGAGLVFAGKIAAVVAGVVVGGASIFYLTNTDNSSQKKTAPTVQTVPAPATTAPAEIAPAATAPAQQTQVAPAETSQTSTVAQTEPATVSTVSKPAVADNRSTHTREGSRTSGSTQTRPGIKLDPNNATRIDHPPTIPGGQK